MKLGSFLPFRDSFDKDPKNMKMMSIFGLSKEKYSGSIFIENNQKSFGFGREFWTYVNFRIKNLEMDHILGQFGVNEKRYTIISEGGLVIPSV